MSSCFEHLTRRLWCRGIGDFVDPRECTTCDDASCEHSRASDEARRQRRCRH